MYIVLADGLQSEDLDTEAGPDRAVAESATAYASASRLASIGPRFVCQICQESFSRPENLSRHRRSQHGGSFTETCPHCNKSFARSDILKRHIRAKHAAASQGTGSASTTTHGPSIPPTPSSGMRVRTVGSSLPKPSVNRSKSVRKDVPSPPNPLLDGYRQAPVGYRESLDNSAQHLSNSPATDLWLVDAARNSADLPTMPPSSDHQHDTSSHSLMPSAMSGDYNMWLSDYLTDDSNNWIVNDTSPVLDLFNTFLADPEPAQDSYPVADQTRSLRTPESMNTYVQDDTVDQVGTSWSCSPAMYEKLVNLWSSHGQCMELPVSYTMISQWLAQYFGHFQHQLPVFHLPTLDLDQTPPLLIGAIAAVGACQGDNGTSSHSVIVHFVRGMLHICLASRKPAPLVKILAHLLLMIAGLFVGDKECYETAESSRGSLLSLCRTVDLFSSIAAWRDLHHERQDDPDTRWDSWLRLERRIRLAWAVLLIDNAFPALLDLPAYHSEMDIVKMLLPCEAHFWNAASGIEWSGRLGMNLLPPARPLRESLCHCRPHGDETTTFTPDDSASLSCVAVVHRHIYNFRSGLALSLSSFMNSPPFSCAMGPELSEDAVVEHQALTDSLECWHSLCCSPDARTVSLLANLAKAFHHVGYIRLNVSVVDLYAAAGRGEAGSKQVAPLIRAWTIREEATTAVTHAMELLESVATNDSPTSPFYPFMVFISITCIWAYLAYTDPSDTLNPTFVANSNRISACVQRHLVGPENRGTESTHQVISLGLSLLRRARGWQIRASLVLALGKLL